MIIFRDFWVATSLAQAICWFKRLAASRQEELHLFESNMATSGTITGDTPEMLKPLLDEFQATRVAMQKDIEQDPVPEVSCDQISSTVKWLKEVVQAMNAYSDSFSRLALSALSDDELHRNQALARESSRQLTLLFADKSKSFTKKSQCQVMKLGMGSQSSEIRVVQIH